MICDVTRPCYACGTRSHDGTRYSRYGFDMFEIYEECVEAIEAQKDTFRITDIWRAVRDLPHHRREWYSGTISTRASYAVHDMAAHGLIVCLRKARNNPVHGERCIEWRVKR